MERLKTLERPGLNIVHKTTTLNEDRRCRGEIQGWAERQFFNLVKPICDKRGWKIQYEPKTFTVKYRNSVEVVEMSTAPDFVITRRPDQKEICIELDRTYYDPTEPHSRDPKIRQKRIMNHFPNVKYVVLYRQNMDKLEKKHPPISFKPPRR